MTTSPRRPVVYLLACYHDAGNRVGNSDRRGPVRSGWMRRLHPELRHDSGVYRVSAREATPLVVFTTLATSHAELRREHFEENAKGSPNATEYRAAEGLDGTAARFRVAATWPQRDQRPCEALARSV